MVRQIPLPFAFNREFDLEHFYAGPNAEQVEHLQNCSRGLGERLVFVWGPTGTGKTHLLNACCQTADRFGRSAAYLPLAAIKSMGTKFLEGMEQKDLVCLDDADLAAGDADWEFALFTLLQRIRERNGSLIASGREPPSGIPYRLPDLLSRLSWGLTLRLDRLSDDDKIAALELFARARGMILTRSVIHYLLTRENRDLSSLRRLVCRLDHATLAAKRKLTLPFVKTFLSDSP